MNNFDTFEHKGRTFKIESELDQDNGAPWDNCDWHGVIFEAPGTDKRPGWRKITEAGRRDWYWFYDVQASTAKARKEGWDAPPYGGTAGERAARAVAADFEYCRGWLNDEWHYACLTVTLLDKNGNETEFSDCLCGVEDRGDYLMECAREMAETCLAEEKRALAAERKETRERNYWAARDVMTA